ncbi:synaptogyrin-2-like [Hydractinia symbiolongicarpus]|uniref:synaptogyrin-2-like n=1 Tax=Hydractinia symbiolongicarpus TaxID=13093 RepID=UPI0025501FC2|nr:synaptogyrin-2-like [Hydractinia symbiolongicarpus]
MEGHGTSYGGSYSGGDFDLVEFVKRPRTICRFLSIIFTIVVFGCISAACYDDNGHCIFNRNVDACQFGTAIGVLAFLACLLFLAVDAQFNGISSAEMRKHLVIADLGISGFWAFLWFVCFCFLANQWQKSDIKSQNQTNHARAAIAFSFFSIFTWVALAAMAYQRYKQGDSFSNVDQQDFPHGNREYGKSPYASFPHPGEDEPASYQQQPFGVPQQPFGVPPPQQPVKTEYNVPEY